MKLISWNTTKKCNLYCKHCYRNSDIRVDTSNELNTDEAKTLITDVKKAGFNMMILSGGEPLLRDDIFELIEYGTRLGLMMCLGSNGTLINESNIKKIKDSGIKSIAMSIDSTDPKIHDEFRGLKGAFKKTVEAIKLCIKNDIRVQVNTTISKLNNKEIHKLLSFFEDLGAKNVHVLFLVETGRGKNISDYSLNKDEYEKALRDVLSFESDMFVKPTCAPQSLPLAEDMNLKIGRVKKGCIAGSAYASVLHNGDVNICPYANVKCGNIRKDSFYNIWNESPIFKALRYNDLKGDCGSCKYINSCGGCRARAFSKTGDFLEKDPYCLLDKEEIYEKA